MPTTFYLSFQVVPGDEGLVDRRIEGADAHCWVVEDDPISAQTKAVYHIRKSGWKINAQETLPVEVQLEHFRERDLGEKCFLEAQEVGIATFIVGHTPAKDLHTQAPVRQTPVEEFDLHGFIQIQQAIRSHGKCLYYQQTDKCHQIIDAHSIQKNGALSLIARDGHVYSGSQKYTDIRRNKGKIVLVKTHINTMSTFRGLCHYHDNLIFRPIDSAQLQPSLEQVFLYAYRSILRERFAKECAVEIYSEQLNTFNGTEATRELIQGARDGNRLGLENLRNQQASFDTSHKSGAFDDIRYVMFESGQVPTAVFSGTILPDWGFNGEPIQNLANQRRFLDLLTFAFAPTNGGWCFLLAWHKASDATCRHFVSTLQAAIRAKRRIEDLLFGLVVKGCENTAFCPDWLARRSLIEKQALEEAMTHGADPLKLTLPNYLQTGIAGVHEWQFDNVQDNLR